MNGPFEVELKIRVTDGKDSAILTYSLPVGVVPTKEAVNKAAETSMSEVCKQLGHKWRLMNRHEFENSVIADRIGGQAIEFATKHDWDE